MSVIHGTEEKFEELIKGELVLVDFFATWCGPCKMLSPILEELKDVSVVKIDVDECPNLARKFGIMSVPTLMIFKDGELKDTKYGAMPKPMLESWINQNK